MNNKNEKRNENKMDESLEEYEIKAKKLNEIDKQITDKSLLINRMDNNRICPFCDNITTLEENRKKLLELMKNYNEIKGNKYYLSHIEGNKEWKL